MKKILLLITGAALFTTCSNKTKSVTACEDTTAAKSSVTLPYTPFYSSSFKMGNPEYSATILQGSWKVWENNNMNNWVLVWATEINTKADGTKDNAAVMETWRINKDGKAYLLLQYDRAKRKK